MSNKARHDAALLVHQLGSGIDALGELPHPIAMENAEALGQCFMRLGDYLIHIHDIEMKKNNQLRMCQ